MSAERFDVFVERRLYGPDGFYTTGGQAGRRRGDFVTSPEVGPLFGEVMVNACTSWWNEMGQPEPFTVVDLGTGPGALLRSMELAIKGRSDEQLRDTQLHEAWRLLGVDRAGPHGGAELPDDLSQAVIIGNELLDNIPFRVLEVGDQVGEAEPFEIFVESGREVLLPADLSDEATARVLALPGIKELTPGTRFPVLERANALVSDLVERGAGRLCLIDYGGHSTASLAERGGWLRGYRQHQRVDDIYRESESCDITTDVALDQLPAEPLVELQAEFLQRHGLSSLVDDGRHYWRAHAAKPDLTALRMRSRISESEALTDPSGLGSWFVAVW